MGCCILALHEFANKAEVRPRARARTKLHEARSELSIGSILYTIRSSAPGSVRSNILAQLWTQRSARTRHARLAEMSDMERYARVRYRKQSLRTGVGFLLGSTVLFV